MGISPDGQIAATASAGDGTIKIWNAADGSFLRTIPAFYGQVYSVAISPDSQTVAGGSDVVFGLGDATLKIWNIADGSVTRAVNPGALYAVWSLAYSPAGDRIAAACNDGKVRIFDLPNGGPPQTLNAHAGQVFAVAWSSDGQTIASGGADNLAKLWDADSGGLLHTLAGHSFFVASVAFSPDSASVATGSWDRTARLWGVASGAGFATFTTTSETAIYAVAWLPNGQTVAGAGSEATNPSIIRLWDVASETLSGTLPGNWGVSDLAYSEDGSFLISSGYEGTARLWDPANGTLLHQLGEVRGPVNAVTYSNAGEFFAAGSSISPATPDALGADAELWEADSGVFLRRFVGHQDVINAVTFSPDDTTLATAAGSPPPDTNDPTVKLWDVSTGMVLLTLPGHAGGSTAAAFAPDGTIVASGGRDAKVKIWDVANGALLHMMSHPGGVTDLAFRPNGELLSCGSTVIRVWNAETGALLRTISGGNVFGIQSIDLSPDAQFVAAAGDAYGNNLKMFRIDDGALIQQFAGDLDSFLSSVAFSVDGSQLIAGSPYTHRFRVWDVQSAAMLTEFAEETGWGPWIRLPVDVSPDGATFGFGRGDATVVVTAWPGPATMPGDMNGDGQVSLDDYAAFAACLTGPHGGIAPGCDPADLEVDSDVDLRDFVLFAQNFTGSP